jgi:hypothetical protein
MSMSAEADRIAVEEVLDALSFTEIASTLPPKNNESVSVSVSVSSQPDLASHTDEAGKVECEKDIPKWFEDDSDEEYLDEEKCGIFPEHYYRPVDPDTPRNEHHSVVFNSSSIGNICGRCFGVDSFPFKSRRYFQRQSGFQEFVRSLPLQYTVEISAGLPVERSR